MSTDLHARLTREIDDHIAGYDRGDQIGHGYHALRAVVELHAYGSYPDPGMSHGDVEYCTGCEEQWPCKTTEAIARELGITTEEDRRG